MSKTLTLLAALAMLVLPTTALGETPDGLPQLPAAVETMIPGVAEAKGLSIAATALAMRREIATESLRKHINSHNTDFGGLIIEPDGSNIIFTTFRAKPASLSLPSAVPITFVDVTFSVAELEAAQIPALAASPRDKTAGVGTSLRNNSVRLVLTHPLTKQEQDDVRSAVAPIPVIFELGSALSQASTTTPPRQHPLATDSHGTDCVSRTNCAKWRGGIPYQNSYELGSLGIWGRKDGSNVPKLLASGHVGLEGEYFYHNNQLIGDLGRTSYNCCWHWTQYGLGFKKEIYSDSGRLNIYYANHETLANNYIFKTSTQNDYSLNWHFEQGGFSVGSTVCWVGHGIYTEGWWWRCGAIQDLTYYGFTSDQINGVEIIGKQLETLGLAYNGDSGGTTWGYGSNGIGWAGLVSARNGTYDRVYHSKSWFVISDMLTQPCHTYNCQ